MSSLGTYVSPAVQESGSSHRVLENNELQPSETFSLLLENVNNFNLPLASHDFQHKIQ